jgi:hypothetical protein
MRPAGYDSRQRRALYQEMIEESKAKMLDHSIAWQMKLRKLTSLDEAARMQVIVEILMLHSELIRLEQDIAIARRRLAEMGEERPITERQPKPPDVH